MSLFRGPRGDVSSKRLFGLGCFLAAVVYTFASGGHPDSIVLGIWLGPAVTVFVTQALTKS